MFWKKLTKEQYIKQILAKQRHFSLTLEAEVPKLCCPALTGGELRVECDTLSLWISTVLINDNSFKDEIHEHYCINNRMNSSMLNKFYPFIGDRYTKYTSAFNRSSESGEQAMAFGSLMYNIFSGKGTSDIELEHPVEQMKLYSLSMSLLKDMITCLGNLNNKM